MSRVFPWLVLTFVTVMAGSVIIIIKKLTEYASTAEIFLLRFLPASIAAIIIIAIFYRSSIKTSFIKNWKFYVFRETVAVLGFHLTFIYASSILPAGIVALIIATWPAMTIFFAAWLLSEKLTPWKITGGLVAFAGAATVSFLKNGGTDGEPISTMVWLQTCLILMLAPLSASLVTIFTRKYLIESPEDKPVDPFVFSLLSRAPSGIIAILVYFLIRGDVNIIETIKGTDLLFWSMIAVVSLYNSLIGFWLWNWCIQKIPAGSVSSFSYIQIGITLILAWIFFDEPFSPLKIVAAAAIVLGVVLTNYRVRLDDIPVTTQTFGNRKLPK